MLICLRQANTGTGAQEPGLHLRRHLTGPDAQLDFPVLEKFAAEGGSDYFAEIARFGAEDDLSHGTGIAYSFATDRPAGFHDDDLALLKAALPALSLAMMSYAGHTIASSLLAAYLGDDAGRRVHSGAIERGSAESLAGCGKSRDFGKMVMKRARSGNPGLIKSTGYEGAKTNELGWKQHRPTFSAAC